MIRFAETSGRADAGPMELGVEIFLCYCRLASARRCWYNVRGPFKRGVPAGVAVTGRLRSSGIYEQEKGWP